MTNYQSTNTIEHFVVSATQMAAIEERIFQAGMPVAALMEKVAGLITEKIVEYYPQTQILRVGIVVGPGHNGGDAAVVARELHLRGYDVVLYRPEAKGKELTIAHWNYLMSLGVSVAEEIQELQNCSLIVDGLFGFGLSRPLEGEIAIAVETINQWSIPVVSLDLPSGIDTDTGEVLGSAIEADHTFCLGLWKRAFFQEVALPYLGKVELIDFGIPLAAINPPSLPPVSDDKGVKRMSNDLAYKHLPLPRPLVTHKYKQGHLLIIAGSSQYAGGVILTGLGARASGVGMVSIAVPASLKPILVTHLPEALIIACPETDTGAIAELPEIARQWDKYSTLAVGPGLTLDPPFLPPILEATSPLILDADALNAVAEMNPLTTLRSRSETTILTPHLGEFKRLFPNIIKEKLDRITSVQRAAKATETTILLKGARSIIAGISEETWVIPESTPALARGGSGDVLTGLLGGLVAQGNFKQSSPASLTATAAQWHAQTGIIASQEHSDLGVDAFTLTQYLTKFPL